MFSFRATSLADRLLSLPPAIRARAYATATTAASDPPPSPGQTSFPPPWRPSTVLDDWVQREARPTSLRQLTFFGRELTERRLIQSANYCRLELPTRIAHRLRNMQTLPYAALTNRHISHVYELYYRAFEFFRKAPEVRDLDDNEHYCDVLRQTLREHLAVIPQLAMGTLLSLSCCIEMTSPIPMNLLSDRSPRHPRDPRLRQQRRV